MKVFMIGGTGLLGCEAAKILIEKGHEVKSVALPPLPEGAPIPQEMEIIFGDINKKSDDEVREMLKGCDTFIFAAGVDERVEFPAPVYDAYYKFNIAPLKRLLPLCKEMGLKRAVVLGSYFSWLAKERPDMPICEKNPYIRSRIEQEKVCESFADESFDVSVLELPYIFGTQPGRRPVWVILIEQIAFMDKWPFTMYPKGGTTMLTVHQVGQVIAGAAEKHVGGFRAWKIGMYNMTWKEFLAIVYEARGMKGRKVVCIPPWMMKMGMGKVVKDYAARGVDSGMDPMYLPYIMDVNLFTEQKDSLELGATEDDIRAAIFDSIKVSEDAYNGKVKLLEMKGE
ncbi:MAG TPA: NAD-dependent epimerase/dehydratase family protein [Candidatus Fimenecus excrementigallinarum]|uniref:NAD-dependent epimerase/dehydratase family protein n=1 Tax=Candidatus Fimenecus excrementigallinarum TaxID=2840816 RepID=A0A9D1IFH2_9FIRM|nr:NAD-dependent epimerase/dehydratase family protein [Candidatus Fimenecus excrementigallinarum]